MKVIHYGYIVYLPTYWIPSLSFHVNRPFHSRYTAFFTLKIQGQLSHGPWLRSKFKVTKKVPLPPTHIPFAPWQPIPGVQLIQILTLKLQCQVHSWRLHRGSNITSTHIPFIPCRSALPIPEIWLFKTKQIWGIWKLRPAYRPEMPNLGQNRWCFVPCDLEIWQMTLKNNRASLLCCFKFCATFHSHRWIQTGVTVRKRTICVKIGDFFVTCDPEIWWMTLKTRQIWGIW